MIEFRPSAAMRDGLSIRGRDPSAPWMLCGGCVAKANSIEMGYTGSCRERAGMRSEQPALQGQIVQCQLWTASLSRSPPWSACRIVGPLAEALLTVSGVAVRYDVGVGRDLPFSEALPSVIVIILDIGERTLPLLRIARTGSLCSRPFPDDVASSSCCKGPSGSLSGAPRRARQCSQLRAVFLRAEPGCAQVIAGCQCAASRSRTRGTAC